MTYGPQRHRPTGGKGLVAAIWQGEALDGSGPLEIIDGPPSGGPQYEIEGVSEAFIPEYHPQEILEMAQKLYTKAKG